MIELKQLLEEGQVKWALLFGENVPAEIKDALTSILGGKRLFWVQNADPDSDLGDYKGYMQSSWEEALDVAKTVIEEMDRDEALEVCELAIVRSQIVKSVLWEEPDDDPD